MNPVTEKKTWNKYLLPREVSKNYGFQMMNFDLWFDLSLSFNSHFFLSRPRIYSIIVLR